MDRQKRVHSREWEKILSEQAESGLSASHFCRDRGIRPSSYFSAKKRQRLAQSQSVAADSPARNVSPPPDRKSGITASAALRSTFLSVQLSDETGTVSCSAPAIRVQLRGGHQIWVESGFDAAHLRHLVAVLESAS